MVRHITRISLAVVAAFGLGSGAIAADAAAAPASATSAPAAAPITVYDTALAAGWQNWSWAKTELSIDLGGSARKPIKVEAGPWAALYLHHDGFSTAGLTKVTMLLQGSTDEALVRVFGLIGGKVASDGHLVKIGNKGWTRMEVSLAELGVADKNCDGLWVQNASAVELPKFYVTEIRIE